MQEALPLFAKMTPEQLKQAALELGIAGQQGIDLKDPTPKHTLKAFLDAFSGMEIVSYMHAAFQQVMPGADVGIDLSKEYAAVKGGGLTNRFTHLRQLLFDVRTDPAIQLPVFLENSQGVFAHFLSGKEFRGGVSEVEAQLHAVAMDLGTQFEVGQQ